MLVKCTVCNIEFESTPVPQSKCGTLIASENAKMVSVVNTICPECADKETKAESK